MVRFGEMKFLLGQVLKESDQGHRQSRAWTYCTAQSMRPIMQPRTQNNIDPTMFPCPASWLCAMLTACLIMLIMATTRLPKQMLPNE